MGGVFPWICAQPCQKAGSRQMRNRVLMAQSGNCLRARRRGPRAPDACRISLISPGSCTDWGVIGWAQQARGRTE